MDIRQVMVRKAFGPRNCKEAAQKQRTNSSVWAPVVMLWQKGCWKIHMHVSRGVLNRSRGSERVTDCILCTVLWTGHWILVYNSVVHLKKKKRQMGESTERNHKNDWRTGKAYNEGWKNTVHLVYQRGDWEVTWLLWMHTSKRRKYWELNNCPKRKRKKEKHIKDQWLWTKTTKAQVRIMHIFISRGLINHSNKIVKEAVFSSSFDVSKSRAYSFYRRYKF